MNLGKAKEIIDQYNNDVEIFMNPVFAEVRNNHVEVWNNREKENLLGKISKNGKVFIFKHENYCYSNRIMDLAENLLNNNVFKNVNNDFKYNIILFQDKGDDCKPDYFTAVYRDLDELKVDNLASNDDLNNLETHLFTKRDLDVVMANDIPDVWKNGVTLNLNSLSDKEKYVVGLNIKKTKKDKMSKLCVIEKLGNGFSSSGLKDFNTVIDETDTHLTKKDIETIFESSPEYRSVITQGLMTLKDFEKEYK